MRRSIILVVFCLGFFTFWVWYRQPAGRGFSTSLPLSPHGMKEFKRKNPDAPAEVDGFVKTRERP